MAHLMNEPITTRPAGQNATAATSFWRKRSFIALAIAVDAIVILAILAKVTGVI